MNHLNRPRLSLVTLVTVGTVAVASSTNAQVLLQEGFNYTSGSNLGANAPWGGGSSATLQVGSGDLTYSGLNDLGGNDLVVTSGAASSDTNIFSNTTYNAGTLYFSFLIDATTLPTANNYLISLNPAANKPSGSADEFSFYTGASGAGWKIGVRTSGGGGGATYESAVLNLNTTYFIVGEYNFGTLAASLYLDPVAGNAQPGTPDATQTGTGVAGGIEDIGVKSQSAVTQGDYILDNFIIGQSWSDVTPVSPIPEPATVALSAVGLLGLAARLRRAHQ